MTIRIKIIIAALGALFFGCAGAGPTNSSNETFTSKTATSSPLVSEPNTQYKAKKPTPVEATSSKSAAGFVGEVAAYVEKAVAANPEDAEYNGWGRDEIGNWRLPKSWCEERLGVSHLVNACTMRETAGGKAAVIVATGECEEWCEISSWLVVDEQGPIKLPEDTIDDISVAAMIVTADMMYGYTGGIDMCGPGELCPSLVRLNLNSMNTTRWSTCGMPSFSPDEKWVLCRGVSGEVMRMPVGGGPFETIYRLDSSISIESGPETGLAVEPVTFENNTTMIIRTGTPDGIREIKTPWPDVKVAD
ncbi:MAG: hypothetical protein JXX29_01255 [Deltaproteobacteria bacterium]|nr:hypothetical protein [Deltaproteobacteria bacterium]MBN2670266.1 hypothetical protein [Deltaproteobacteria bacterium]